VLLAEPDDDPGVERFFTAAEEFDLRRIAVTPGEESSLRGRETPRILLCVEGAVTAQAESDAGAGRTLSRGHSLFATARAGGITLEGEGVVYVAGVPEAA
jgi:mannose-6-phosphate isomerase class I